MANGSLPSGFVLDEPQEQSLPSGFVLDEPETAPPAASPRMARGQQVRQETEANLAQLRAAAEQSGIPLARDLEEVGMSPELTSFTREGILPAIKSSAASLFTFDNAELGNILEQQVGAQIVTDVEGNLVAKMPSGGFFAVNKPDLSPADVAQGAANIAAFSPASILKGAIPQALGGATTQMVIEGGQAAAGGEFNPQDVALAAAAPVAIATAQKAIYKTPEALGKAKQTLGNIFGPKAPELINPETALPVPAFEKALQRRGLTFSAVIDDVDNIPKPLKRDTVDDVARKLMIRKLESGSKSKELAPYRLEATATGSRIVDDDLATRAIKQGFEAGDVQAAKASNLATRREKQRMLRSKRSIASNRSQQNVQVPLDIAGEHTAARFEFVRSRADELAKELKDLANGVHSPGSLSGPGVKSGLKGLPVQTGKVQDAVLSSLEDIFIDIPEEVLTNPTKLSQFINTKGAFRGSNIAEDKTSQDIIKKTIRLLSDGTPDALGAHRLKRQLDTLIDYKKKSFGGLTETGQSFAKSIRAELNNAVRDVSPTYRRINDSLSLALQTMGDLQDAIPRKVNLRDGGAASALGQELRKLQTHYASRQSFTNATQNLDDTVRQLGGDFDVKITDLVDFDNLLENRFGASRTRTFKGQIEEAGKNIMRPQSGAREFLESRIIERVGKKFGPDDEKAFNIMQEILVRGE